MRGSVINHFCDYYNNKVSPMKQGREGCGVASLNNVLYVAGGNQYGNRDLNTVEW